MDIQTILTLKHLYSMILSVADDDVPAGHDGDAFQTLELSVTRSPGTEGSEEGAVRVEDLDAVVAGVGNHDVALVVYRYTPEDQKYR